MAHARRRCQPLRMDEDSDIPGVGEEAEEFVLDEELTEEDDLAIAEAEQAIRDGRVISNEAMMRWIKAWGTENELPPPESVEQSGLNPPPPM